MSETEQPIAGQPVAEDVVYGDDDLVYVDPDARTVVGRVTFDEKGNAKKLERPSMFAEPDDDEPEAKPAPAAPAKPGPKGKVDRRPPRKPRKRYYPWGTYRTMKKIYKIEGKVFEAERTLTLDDVMEKALQEPYWD
jgi:hypothetical protein